jgi:hypothetical protein
MICWVARRIAQLLHIALQLIALGGDLQDERCGGGWSVCVCRHSRQVQTGPEHAVHAAGYVAHLLHSSVVTWCRGRSMSEQVQA